MHAENTERSEWDTFETRPELAEAIVCALFARGHLRTSHVVWEPHAASGNFVRPLLSRGVRVVASDLRPDADAVVLPGVLAPDHAHNALAGVPWVGELGGVGWRPDWVIGNPPFARTSVHACGPCRGRGYTVPVQTRAASCTSCDGLREVEGCACTACMQTGRVVRPCRSCNETGWLRTHPPVVLDHVEAALAVARVGVAFLVRMSFQATLERAGVVGDLHAGYPISPRPSFTGTGTDTSEYTLAIWRLDGPRPSARPFEHIVWTPERKPRLRV